MENIKTIAVIFGGRSTEHDVSIVTAISSIIKPLAITSKYRVVPIYISKAGTWYSHPSLADISTYTSGSIEDKLSKLKPVLVGLDGGLSIVEPGLRSKTTKIDVVFPSMHGTYGEDGSLMGLLRMASVPFVGCGMAASAAAMDKVTSKLLAQAQNLPVTDMVYFDKDEFLNHQKRVENAVNTLKYPLFVKPAHMGSSIGLTRVNKKADLINALEVAFHYDGKVLVEEGVKDLVEVTLPVMGNEEPIPALLEQPVLPEGGVFDFDTKYMSGGKKGKGDLKTKAGAKVSGDVGKGSQGYSVIPAKLDKALYAKAVKLGIDSYKAVGCEGFARVDMLIDAKTNKLYFNEINPMPGSLYAHNWKKAGVSTVELVEKLIEYGEARHSRDANLSITFDNNFLSQFN